MGRKGMVLKPEWQEVADDFFFTMRDRGCTCFISPPCSYCTHEGNPANLDETDEAWESELVGAIRDAQVPNVQIEPTPLAAVGSNAGLGAVDKSAELQELDG